MNELERGMLLLCCALPESEQKPLTGAEYMRLEHALFEKTALDGENVTVQALRQSGIEKMQAERVCALLGRERELDRYLTRAKECGIGVLTRLSPGYPAALLWKLHKTAPVVLFYRGELQLLQNSCVGLVGSRRLTTEGAAFARRVGALAAVQGRTLVSGGAAGADRTAQQACAALEGNTIVFVADQLTGHIPQERTVYCSEDGFDLQFSTPRAYSRNRLIHAMGDTTFVAQCTCGSGGTWAGTVENLKKGFSHVVCHADGSEAAAALEHMGAELLPYNELTSILPREDAQQRLNL